MIDERDFDFLAAFASILHPRLQMEMELLDEKNKEKTYEEKEFVKLQLSIIADWLYDTHQYHPEMEVYVKRLRSTQLVRMRTLLDIGTKFGNRKTRKLTAKIGRLLLRSREKWCSRGAVLAWMKKRFSLTTDWKLLVTLKANLKPQS